MKKIKQQTLDFLSELKQNNDREWFGKNRLRYDEAKLNYESFVQELIDNITEFDPILKGLKRRAAFTGKPRYQILPDKTIYKTHFGAFIVKGEGRIATDTVVTIAYRAGGSSMIAGGSYMPPAPWLKASKERIEEWKGLIRSG